MPWHGALSLALLAAAVVLLQHASTAQAQADSQDSSERSPFTPSVSIKASCPGLRIALVNGVPYHYELLVGLLHVLQPFSKQLDVFLHPSVRSAQADGAWEFIKWSRATFKKVPDNAEQLRGQYALAILVSIDYELDANKALVAAMQPHTVVAIVHNSDFTRLYQVVALEGARVVRLATLSPHVARSLANNTQRPVEPILPIYPFRPAQDCLHAPRAALLGACLHGFAIQGKFSNLRRNYAGIWAQMAQRRAALDSPQLAPLFKVNVLGKGANRLAIPADLARYVTLHRRLAYGRYYDVIHHTLALAPVLASARYYTDKFSSTIVVSLSTGTPMIVNAAFLRAYSMFSEEEVYLQRPAAKQHARSGSDDDGGDEGEVDVMIRLMRSPPDALLAVRQALAALRARLNQHAFVFFDGIVAERCRAQGV